MKDHVSVPIWNADHFCQENFLLIHEKINTMFGTLPVIYDDYANIHDYFFKRCPSILAFFLSGSSSAHALSFNRPTIMPKTSFTLLHSDLYELEFWSKAFLVNSIEYAVSLALDIFPGLY